MQVLGALTKLEEHDLNSIRTLVQHSHFRKIHDAEIGYAKNNRPS